MKKKKTKSKPENISPPLMNKNVIRKVLFKAIVVIAIICSILYYTEKKEFFNPDNTNNHTLKKWDSFYSFTEKKDVDVVLIGNSHLYTGINPKNLSNT